MDFLIRDLRSGATVGLLRGVHSPPLLTELSDLGHFEASFVEVTADFYGLPIYVNTERTKVVLTNNRLDVPPGFTLIPDTQMWPSLAHFAAWRDGVCVDCGYPECECDEPEVCPTCEYEECECGEEEEYEEEETPNEP